MSEVPQTDVSRPSALPTANLRGAHNPNQVLVDQSSEDYLAQIEEEWNKKVDVEVETLVDGMVDLVGLASVSPRASFPNNILPTNFRLVIKINLRLRRKLFRLSRVQSPWCALRSHIFLHLLNALTFRSEQRTLYSPSRTP